MSATVAATTGTGWGDRTQQKIKINTIMAGAPFALAHGGPAGATPKMVTHNVTTQPTSQDPVTMSWEGSSTTDNTVTLRFVVPQGGDISGAVVDVYVDFEDAAGGGIS